jgi:hypothetical protein
MSSAPDHIYLDLFTLNSDNKGSGVRTALNFTESRTTNILDNPSNYFLSIVRFQADTPSVSLPVFMPVILCDGVNTDPNKTIYTITMASPSISNGLTNCYSVNVNWTPEDQQAIAPNNTKGPGGVLTKIDYTTGYYNAYTARWWIACVNNALAQCWNLVTSNSYTTFAPYMTIDPNTNMITLLTPYSNAPNTPPTIVNFAQNSVNATGNGTSRPLFTGPYSFPVSTNYISCAMFFNEPMMNLFSAFPSVYYGNTINAAVFGIDTASVARIANRWWLFNYYVLPINYNGNNIVSPTAGSQWIATYSDYSPVPMWNPISSIVFTSSLLPIKLSLTSVPNVFNSNIGDQTYSNSGNNSATTNMLSDIQVGLVSGNEYKPSVLYVPAGEYRLIDLLGSNPINQASFGVSFKTKFGVVVPFRLGAQCGANIKIMFRRKRFNLGNLPPYDTN